MNHCLIYSIENKQYALDLYDVKCVLQAVEVTAIPHSPKTILGAISVHGDIINVVNMRALLGVPTRKLDLSDHFIHCKFKSCSWILWVDRVLKIRDCTEKDLIFLKPPLSSQNENFVIKNEEPMTLFFNLEKQLELACIPS